MGFKNMEPMVVELKEYDKPASLLSAQLSKEDGQRLIEKFGKQIEVQSPNLFNPEWQVKNCGWVGYIPLTPALHFQLTPKVPLGNLFGMLNYAYKFDVHWLEGVYKSDSVSGFYDHLANALARRVLTRMKKGIYRSYLEQEDDLPYLREHLNIQKRMRSPSNVKLPCNYHEHTADIEDNQILAWTLYLIARSGLCSTTTLSHVRHAYHALGSYVTTNPFSAYDCVRRSYNRLNDDYRSLHAICRFFLEQSGAGHHLGDRGMIPFILEMDRLFEKFVAEWLKTHLKEYLPSEFEIHDQEQISISADGALQFKIDLVLVNIKTGKTVSVLDTKYKYVDSPSTEDVSQVISYADVTKCTDAVLIYPAPLKFPKNEKPGSVRYRTLCFDLGKNLDEAGKEFVENLLSESLQMEGL